MQRRETGGGRLADNVQHARRWLAGEPTGPLTIEVGPTRGCNHNCVHCGFQQYDPYGQRLSLLDCEAFLRFLDDFRALGGQEVYFAGNGEPLLNPALPEWVRHGAELGLEMALSSNGIPLTAARGCQILPFMSWIRFSVNGGTADVYADVHRCRPADFSRLERNISAAVRFRNASDLAVRLALQFIVYELNWGTIAGIVAFHGRCGTDELVFRGVISRAGAAPTLPPAVRQALQEAQAAPGVRVRWETFDPAGPASWSTCRAINLKTNMDDQGNLITCNRNLLKNSIYGNIHARPFREIWLGSVEKQKLFSEVCTGQDIEHCGKWCQVAYDNALLDALLPATPAPGVA
ncbi:MAG: radical SAM protein [Candidatus Schekmanbacteria bacterium]|nr:radical SAM protein [Candidatus Schekmanbacteria bacterium]